jgi:hypothetical protein
MRYRQEIAVRPRGALTQHVYFVGTCAMSRKNFSVFCNTTKLYVTAVDVEEFRLPECKAV